MKKLSTLLLLIFCLAMLSAVAQNIIALPIPQSDTPNALRTYVMQLAQAGTEIYYYNESYVIAGTDEGRVPNAVFLCSSDSGRLYLISKHNKYKEIDLSTVGEILLDLGSQILLRSNLDEVQLRAKIRSPLTPMALTPMKLAYSNEFQNTLSETRTTIQELVNQVSVDSVAGFIQSLQDFQTRYALADNRLAVANWIKGQFLRFGITNSELYNFQWNNTTQYDVVATIPGTVYPDTYIIVGGHHDSITNDTPTVFAPGADDNASGAVAAIEMARVMMATGFQPKCSIRFVTFAAEEFGLWGSKAYAQMAQQTNMDIRLMMNHDMIANTNPNPDDLRVLLMPYDGFMQHTDHAAAITTQYTPLIPVYGSLNLTASDSYSFWQRGFPVVYYFEYNFSQVYHSNNDTMANISPAYAAKVIQASVAVVASFANMPSAPSNLTVHDAGNGSSLELTWSGVTDPAFSHYKIAWGTQQGLYPFEQTTTDNTWTINGLTESQLCHIALSTMDVNGNESYRVYSYGTPHLIPLTPINFVDSPVLQGINLSWTPNSELDLSSYKLYRSLDSIEIGDLIATLNPNVSSYNDTNLSGSLDYYCYRLCAVDTANNQSSFTEVVMSRPVTLDMGILEVDETKNFSGSNPFNPTDEMVDSFYADLMQDFEITTTLDLEATPMTLRLADIGIYSSILWHGNDYSDVTTPYNCKEALKQYINLGGKVFFNVYHPSQAFELNAGYPANFGESTFINEVLGISSVDYDGTARFKYAISQLDPFSILQVDSLKTPVAFNGHIFHVEGMVPTANAQPVYVYGSDYDTSTPQGSLNGDTIGIIHPYGLGKAITFSFPLYHMEQASSETLLRYLFGTLFNEPVANSDLVEVVPQGVQLLPNYPNPFASESFIPYLAKDNHNVMRLEVYNLKGQLVRTLFNDVPESRGLLSWNGLDKHGKPAANGIYYLKAVQNGVVSTRKMIILK
jgi:hypothetical protein